MALNKLKKFVSEEVMSDELAEDEYYDAENVTVPNSGKMILLEPRAYSESQQIADHLKKRNTVVVNMKRVTPDQAKRIVDFLSGTVYAIGGDLQKIGGGIFLCTPKNVNGTIIAIILKIIDEAYTILFALLSINGILEVLIICIPTRLETTPYENQIVWKTAASLIPSINQIEAKTIISKIELKGPINNMKCFKLLMFHFLGSLKYSISTLSKGKVN